MTHIAWHHDYDTKEKIRQLYIPTEWLCDSCHCLFHQLNEDNFNDEEVSTQAIYNVVDILSSIDLTECPEELYEDYARVVGEMTENFLCGFIKYGNLTLEELEELENILKEEVYYDIGEEERNAFEEI